MALFFLIFQREKWFLTALSASIYGLLSL
jgi:hypothetical protein